MLPSVRVAGKLSCQGPINAIAPGMLLHVQDLKTGVLFLIDTGAVFSVVPFSSISPPTGPVLRGPNGVNIPCWGEVKVSLSFGNRSFDWTFLRAAVDFAIIGVDFLSYYNLSVDVAAGCLHCLVNPPVECQRSPTTVAAAVNQAPSPRQEFAKV